MSNEMTTPKLDLSAASAGMSARADDDDNGTLTDNPYTPDTAAFHSWYRGYNFDEENPEWNAEIRSMKP